MGEKVTVVTKDIAWQQEAPAQSGRVSYTPGKPNAPTSEATWPIDFMVKTGNPVFDGVGGVGSKGMAYTRIIDIEKGIVCEQELRDANVQSTVSGHSGSWSVSGSYTMDVTDSPNLPMIGRQLGSIGVAE